MKFLQYTSTEKQGASTAPHWYSSPTPCWLSPQCCTLLPTCWQDIQVTQPCTSCTGRHRWPKDDSFKLVSSVPVLAPIRNQTNLVYNTGCHRCETQEACEAAHSNRVSAGMQGHTSSSPALAVLRATGQSQQEPWWGGLAPHGPQQPPPSGACRALCPHREDIAVQDLALHGHTHPPGPELLPSSSSTPRDPSTLQEPLLGAPHSRDLLSMVRNMFLTTSKVPLNVAMHCASSRCMWLVLPPSNSIFRSLFSIYMYL